MYTYIYIHIYHVFERQPAGEHAPIPVGLLSHKAKFSFKTAFIFALNIRFMGAQSKYSFAMPV